MFHIYIYIYIYMCVCVCVCVCVSLRFMVMFLPFYSLLVSPNASRQGQIYLSYCNRILEIGHHFEEWRLLGCYIVRVYVLTNVSEELSASFIKVTRIGELGTRCEEIQSACVGC
jgi:hypothetical protein